MSRVDKIKERMENDTGYSADDIVYLLAELEDSYDQGFLKGTEVGDGTAARIKKQCNDDFNRLSKERREFVAKRQELEAKLKAQDELHNMQLAGISTASICNTEYSMAEQLIARDNPYWTVAYSDIIKAVKREMELRVKLKAVLSSI